MRFRITNLFGLVLGLCINFSFSRGLDQTDIAYHWTESGLLDLKPQVINIAKEEFEVLILYIYGNWCLSAQSKLHSFEEVATQHQIIKSRLTFGIVNVKNKEEMESYGIKEIPSVLIFLRGSQFQLTWEDDDNADALSLQIETTLKPFLTPSLSADRLKQLQTINGIKFVLFHGEETDPHYWDFYKTAENQFDDKINFYFMKKNQQVSSPSLPFGISFCSPVCQPFKSDDINLFTLFDWVSKKLSNSRSNENADTPIKIEQVKEPILVKFR